MWNIVIVLTAVQLLTPGSSQLYNYKEMLKYIDITNVGTETETGTEYKEDTLGEDSLSFSQDDVLQALEELLETKDAPSWTTRESSISYTCINDTKRFIDGVKRNETWAFQMVDAAGKPGSGIFRREVKWFGSFDECLNTTAFGAVNTTEPEVLYKGSYCSLLAFRKKDVNWIKDLIFAEHNLPVFVVLGVCLPDTCDSYTATIMANVLLQSRKVPWLVGAGCQEREHSLDIKAIVAICVCGIIVVLIISATVYDVMLIQWSNREKESPPFVPRETNICEINDHIALENEDEGQLLSDSGTPNYVTDEKPEAMDNRGGHGTQPRLSRKNDDQRGVFRRMLLGFSLYTNCSNLFDTKQSEGTLTAVEGIRFFSMTWIILGHMYEVMNLIAENRWEYGNDFVGRWSAQTVFSAFLAVDTFFVISGLLTGYLMLKEMNKNQGRINWLMYYILRLLRLTPLYMFILMIFTCLFHYLSDGPLWPKEGFQVNECRDNWWTNLLYVNNLVDRDHMCMGWSWFLANDMQYHIISPIILITLFSHKVVGVGLLLFLLTGTMLTAGLITRIEDIPSGIATEVEGNKHGLKDSNDFYYAPYCRMGPYLVGLAVGHILQRIRCKAKINKVIILGAWCVAIASALAVVYGPYEATNGTPMTPEVNSLYAAVHTSVWGLAVSWVIFVCATGNAGCVNAFLSWKIFVPLSRVTYCAYLVHPIVIGLVYLSQRALPLASDINTVSYLMGFLVEIYIIATVIHLAVELPFLNIQKILFKRERKR